MSDTSLVRRMLPDLEPGEKVFLSDLFRRETVGGGLALIAAAVAVVWANLAGSSYDALRHFEVGPLDLEHWAAEGALTLFFFVAGLELKREFVVGSLRRPADAAVPVVAAVCGVLVPALVYVAINAGGETGGWAIPAATDIAFALAVLAVVGSNLPTPLRAFLLTMAVVDDLIVIVIIATFFTEQVHLLWLLGAGLALLAWSVGQHLRWHSPAFYLPVAVLAWWCVHEGGIHATIAGVALGLLTRVRLDAEEDHSPAEKLEHRLSPCPRGWRFRRSPYSRPECHSAAAATCSATRSCWGWSPGWCSGSRSGCFWARGRSRSSPMPSSTPTSGGATCSACPSWRGSASRSPCSSPILRSPACNRRPPRSACSPVRSWPRWPER